MSFSVCLKLFYTPVNFTTCHSEAIFKSCGGFQRKLSDNLSWLSQLPLLAKSKLGYERSRKAHRAVLVWNVLLRLTAGINIMTKKWESPFDLNWSWNASCKSRYHLIIFQACVSIPSHCPSNTIIHCLPEMVCFWPPELVVFNARPDANMI